MRHRPKSIFVIDYYRLSPQIHIYCIFKTSLAHESGGPGVLLSVKTNGRKSCDSVGLSFIYTIRSTAIIHFLRELVAWIAQNTTHAPCNAGGPGRMEHKS
jgi:hypothetical protein